MEPWMPRKERKVLRVLWLALSSTKSIAVHGATLAKGSTRIKAYVTPSRKK